MHNFEMIPDAVDPRIMRAREVYTSGEQHRWGNFQNHTDDLDGLYKQLQKYFPVFSGDRSWLCRTVPGNRWWLTLMISINATCQP